MGQKRWDLAALASIPLMMTLGNSMLIPILPLMEREIEITPFQSSLLITIYSIIAIVLIPISGYISDKFGRKKVIVPSLILVGIGGIVSAIAAWKMNSPYAVIMIGRFLQGAGAAGAFPVVLPTVGDMFKEEEEASHGLGIIETSNTFGKVLSPILGALLAMIVWYMPFVAIPVLSFISAALVMFLVKVPPGDQKDENEKGLKEFLAGIKETFQYNKRWLLSVFLIGGILMFILFGFLFHFSSILEEQYHIDGYVKGLLLAIPLLFLCGASYLGGKLAGKDKNRMKWLILAGNGVAATGLFFIKQDMSLYMFIIFLSVAGIGIGIALPCLDALITKGIEKEERGSITSFYTSMRYVGVAAGPPIIAIMMEQQPGWIYYSLAAGSILAVILTFFAIRPTPEDSGKRSPIEPAFKN
ncbi:MFS transporter [Alteribacillus iranensis]|uniref:MFS transporter, ACDE family, multidrug resistance protein n=1 Tax=Alteribacillus iranensis TaxID=930128 RepID=A0A1I2ENW8_9BACI|nr:MFS transporter [Alteribacillus iranensis]SFE94128.1 MFS transporter, ACDE family, multidrug resistance protein [Alteribacillus iranensis]